MSELNTVTMTPSSLYDWHYRVSCSDSEVFRVKPSILDNALIFGSRDITVSLGQMNPQYWDKYLSIFINQDCLSPTTARMVEGFLPLKQVHATSVVPEAISRNWQQLAQAGLTEKTYLYILKLASKNIGWLGEGSCPMKAESLAAFLSLWNKISSFAREPEFVLLPQGNLQVEWYKDNHHFAELEFQSDKKIMFGIFDGKSVIEGVAPEKEIVNLLQLGTSKRQKAKSVFFRRNNE